MAILGDKEYYKGIGEIKFEGKESDNPLAFKYYNPDQIVAGKTMRDHFRFAIAYWHTFCGQGGDPFGPGTQNFPWDQSSDPIRAAKDKADAAFEFISKMGFDYFCFHDTTSRSIETIPCTIGEEKDNRDNIVRVVNLGLYPIEKL